MNVLIVDNRDSFTFNLAQLVARVTGSESQVVANSISRWRDLIREREIGAVLISPGPGSPERPGDFGTCRSLILDSDVPLLGVCLGHQGLGHAYGATIRPAAVPMHGRLSQVTHLGGPLFEGIPQTFQAVRYHSLCIDVDSLPASLEVLASTADRIPMAVRHRVRPQYGVQFHPESVLAEFGERLIRNFLGLAAGNGSRWANARKARTARPLPIPKKALRTEPASRVMYRPLDRWIDPQRAFERLYCRSETAFWLDSAAVVPGFSRFSAMGDASGPGCEVLHYRSDPRTLTMRREGRVRTKRVRCLADALRARLARNVRLADDLPFDFQTGLVGFFGYEMRSEFGLPARRVARAPDAAFIDTDRCVVFDHQARQAFLVIRSQSRQEAERWFQSVAYSLSVRVAATRRSRPAVGPVIARLGDGPKGYADKIRSCQEKLAAGESYEICLSSEFAVGCQVEPYAAYRHLRALNPAPYSAYLRFGKLALLSSSPERFLRVARDRTVSAKPIKGTCPRGPDPPSDRRLADWLRSDDKSRSENLMIVDLLRNDIGRVAAVGSVDVPALMNIESYSTVHQLVSTVTGRLPHGKDCLACVEAAFPGGSMTGAPKARTVAIIDRLEERARGPYAGALGFLSYGDRMDLSIVIRTIVIDRPSVTVASGGAIVALSDPRAEFEEMLLKARAPLRALAAACTRDPDNWKLRYATP